MKTIFTMLFAAFGLTAFAANEGRLTLSIAAEQRLLILIDGRSYGSDNNIRIDMIQPGNHTIQVYRAPQREGYGRNRPLGRDLLYSSTVYVRPDFHVDVMVNRFGRALVDERPLAGRGGSWDDGPYGSGNGYVQPMSEGEFDRLLSRVRGQWSSTGRLGTVREAAVRNYFTTLQVRQLIQLFHSDSDRLEVAKEAYRNTTDRHNYYTLFNVFSFQSTREELERFIRDFRQ
jgi:hypothetical protein